MSARAPDFDVLIVGAGPVGAVMAGLLAARKLCARGRVALVADRFAGAPVPNADWDLRVFALSRASERLLKLCDVWASLPPKRVHPYQRMCVWDASGDPDGRGSISFDAAELGEPNLGSIVDGSALQWQCLQGARAAGTTLIEAEVAKVELRDACVSVVFGDGREVRCQLLIGADGPQSRTRTLLGIETAGHTYHQDAVVAHVRTSKPHQDTAWQRFLPSGPLAFLPLSDGRSSIVWSVALPEAERLRALAPAEFNASLTAASGEVLGNCELTTATASFPLRLQYALQYVRPRAALLGDAAHVVHPLAGQGLNLGFLDCAALADVLGDEGTGACFGEHRLLRRYERWRSSENLLAAGAFDALERLFSNADPVRRGLRAAGLGAVGRAPFLKHRLMQHALGMGGDVPRYLKDAPARGA